MLIRYCYDFSKLRGKIREVYGTEREFAKALDRTQNYLTNVFSGKSFFTPNDITLAMKLLNISEEDIFTYFFTVKVHETEQNKRQGVC